MPVRNLLHPNHLEQFKDYLMVHGWEIEETKGCYEVLRARREGRKHPIIIYQTAKGMGGVHNNTEHLTVRDVDIYVVKGFFRWKSALNN